MKVGDLVKFSAPEMFKPAADRYGPWGIIANVKERKGLRGSPKACYTVVWHATGDQYKRTTEWGCYLEKLA